MPALVVGIGNRSRGDDAVGPEVASRVAQLGLPGVAVAMLDEPHGARRAIRYSRPRGRR